jgi:hypothetical protein
MAVGLELKQKHLGEEDLVLKRRTGCRTSQIMVRVEGTGISFKEFFSPQLHSS